jgi:hypothetical protein
MFTPAILRLTRMVLAALLALALTATAYAHRMTADADRLAFIQATGANPSDLCGDTGKGPVAKPPCEACRISGQMLPPRLVGAPVALRHVAGGATPVPGGPALPTPARDPGHPSRAPPAA